MNRFHFDPRDMQNFQNVAETVAERLGDIFNEVGRNTRAATSEQQGKSKIRFDIADDGENVYVFAELPGVRKEDVSVTLNDENVLTIKGDKKRPEADEKNFTLVERKYGTFSRSVAMNEQIEQERITAEFRDGVLTVTLPKLVPVTKEFRVNIQ